MTIVCGYFCWQPGPNLSLLQLKQNLVAKVIELSKEKDKRLLKMQELCDAEHAVCDRLKATPKISMSVDSVPTTKQLEDFEAHVNYLKAKVVSLSYFSLSAFWETENIELVTELKSGDHFDMDHFHRPLSNRPFHVTSSFDMYSS